MKLKFLFFTVLVLFWAGLNSCSGSRGYAASDMPVQQEATVYYDQAPQEESSSSPKMASMSGGMGGIGFGGRAEKRMQSSAAKPSVAKAPVRMVFHDGFLHLRSAEPNKVLDSALAIALSLGGSLENRDRMSMVLKIPAPIFRENLAKFEVLGVLIDRRLTSTDITDAFNDTEMRLRIAQKTLERLQELLKTAVETENKIELLKRIQELTAQINEQTQIKADLLQQAAFSRLTLQVEPFVNVNSFDEEIGAFAWIYRLDPVRTKSVQLSEPLELKAPSAYVALKLEGEMEEAMWACAASDGSEIWARTLENNPQGTAQFWVDAIQFRLETTFAKAEQKNIGSWQMVTFTSRGNKPFQWTVAVSIDPKDTQKIRLVEILWPSLESAKSLQEQALSVLEVTP